VFDYHAAIAIMERESRTQRSSRSRPALFAAFALGFTALGIGVAGYLGVGVTGFMDRVGVAGLVDDWLGPGKPAITASRLQEAPAAAAAPAPAASRPAAPPPVAEVPQKVAEPPQKPVSAPAPDPVPPPPPTAAQPAPRPVAPQRVAEMAQGPIAAPAPEPVRVQPAAARAAPAQQLASATPTAPIKEQQPGGTARLVVAVSPRGEIWIDGKHHGTTPPVTTLDLEPGIRQIEIRSGSRRPYLTYMVVQAGDVRRIRHDFNAKPSGPKTAKIASPR
jgi:hypothetical protein